MLFYFFKVLLLFLLGVQKKKVTKRKNAGFRFEAATKCFPSEAQELASLRQPALLFAGLLFSAFRLKTKAGENVVPKFVRGRCSGIRSWALFRSLFVGVVPKFVRGRCSGVCS